MANKKIMRHASALKAHRQSEARRAQNTKIRSRVRTLTTKVTNAISSKKIDEAKSLFVAAQSAWQKAAKTGVFSRNAASRKISRLASQIASLSKS
jgi:small subunit ribosomal protein S20